MSAALTTPHPGNKVRVLLAEDSSLMRLILTDILRQCPEIELVATATNGQEAVTKTIALNPDVLLCDLLMPHFDGLFVVQQLMKHYPKPVVLLSSLERNHQMVFDALAAGATDFLEKPKEKTVKYIRTLNSSITQTVLQAAGAVPAPIPINKWATQPLQHTWHGKPTHQIIVIAASTGGPGSIETLLSQLPPNLPVPVVIAQHMPQHFIESFASRLKRRFQNLTISIAQQHQPVLPQVYLAPGTGNLVVRQLPNQSTPVFDFTDCTYQQFNNPSADALFGSVAQVYGNHAVGVVLTGMGKDGANGLLKIKKGGGTTIAQNKDTSVVFGMPKAAIALEAAKHTLPLHQMAPFLVTCLEA